ncbi:MAG TPA: transposase [Tepidisphaeraceae bacterium]|nr:transposase [Tepidisphaeraceae bacterium]
MCRPAALSAWIAELETVFLHLSKPQIKVLAQYSLGMVLAGRCGLSCVAFALAGWLDQKVDAVRERLRDWYCGALDKSGRRRQELDVASCFGPLLAWVLQDWDAKELAIALDATTLGRRFAVLAISVVYRAGAIPVAWAVLPATAKGAWKGRWLDLLGQFKSLAPSGLQVIVLADRGLYAKWLYQAIVSLGWHPFLRLNATDNIHFRPSGGDYVPLASLLPATGCCYSGVGTLFRTARTRLPCTLAACWKDGCREGWFVASDLPPQQLDCAWYGLRSWIECSFKQAKSGGWNWQQTRMSDPERAARQWLAMAVAAVLLMRQGAASETPSPPAPSPADGTDGGEKSGAPPPKPDSTTPRRILSVFRKGLLLVQAILLAGGPLPHARFEPEPWPRTPAALNTTAPPEKPP